jgi:hypothetical protein
MKTKPIHLIVIAASAVASMAAVSSPEEARPYPPPDAGREIAMNKNWTILPKADLYEVGASKLDVSSIREMSPTGYRKLAQAAAMGYTGAYYSCPPGKTPYLVRAVYRTGNGPGQFRAERNGVSVAIVFGDWPTLPPESAKYQWSAVVVNLDFTPDAVYTAVSGFQ